MSNEVETMSNIKCVFSGNFDRDDDTMKISNTVEKIIEVLCNFSSFKKDRCEYNTSVQSSLAGAAAELQYKLEHEQLKLVRKYNKPEVSEDFNERVFLIEDLTDEYEDIVNRMLRKTHIFLSRKERRCLFRGWIDDEIINMIDDFISIYNEWTGLSADYLVLMARKEYDNKKFSAVIENVDDPVKKVQLTQTQNKLAEEYEYEISKIKTDLMTYIEDLENLSKELINDYNVIEHLEELLQTNI